MLDSRVERVMQHAADDIWICLFDAEAGREWMGASIFALPEQPGEPFCWVIDAGAATPGVTFGRVMEVIPCKKLMLRMVTFHGRFEVATTIELRGRDSAKTSVAVRFEQFPDEGSAPFELDGYTHIFDHVLEAIDTYLAGAVRSIHHRHRARIGMIPVGAAPGRGLLLHDVTVGSPAEEAGLASGDIVLSTSDGARFNSQEDLDRWMDTHLPGDEVRLHLVDREVAVTFDSWSD